MPTESIRWMRIVLIGIAAEIALSIVVIPVALIGGEKLLNILIEPATLIVYILFGLWVARPLHGRFVLHGVLMGAVAALFYNGLILGASSLPGAPPLDLAKTFSPLYLLSHALKLVGGSIGGWMIARKKQSV